MNFTKKLSGFIYRKLTALSSYSLVWICFFSINLVTGRAEGQVATYYNFSQSNGTYTPIVADYPSTPASIYTTTWDDIAYTFPIPFDFTFNGVLYPAATGYIGLDTDAWFIFSNGIPTMTGQTGGGSWVSISDHTGVYLNGTANNNGFAGLNCDLNNQSMATFTATVTSGSNVLTAVTSVANIRVGTRLSGTGIPNGTVVISNTANTITMSADGTSTGTNRTITPLSSIYYKVTGTAPNRQFVVQWTQAKRYGGTGTDNFNFQMILNEGGGIATNQTLQVVYGGFSATSTDNLDAQVGLRGASSADFNARQSTVAWATTTAASANTDIVRLNNTIFPSSGLTFTWSPCTAAPGAAGAISGTTSVCPNTTQTYSIPAVPGASLYIWTYSGTGVSFSDTTTVPNNSFIFSTLATAGAITVTPTNFCGSGTSSSQALTITTITPASINYPSASYCVNTAGTITVTQTGPAGGTYSTMPATGLTINTSNGTITPIGSTAGTYTVIYTYTSGGCPGLTATDSVTIYSLPVVTATAVPASVCTGGTAQLTADVSSGAGYTVAAIPYSSLSPGGSPVVLWSTNNDDVISAAISMPFTFNYYGSAITQFYVSSNGHIQLQTSSGSANAEQLVPNATTPNNVVALAWDDLVIDPATNTGSAVRYFVNGVTPNRVMVIDYINLRFLGGTGAQNVTGQIRLYENDFHIEVAAASVNDNGAARTKTLGIENSTGTVGLSPAGRNQAVWNVTNEAWSFNLPAGTHSYTWSPATYLSSTSLFNPVASGVAGAIAYTVTATNSTTGCSNTANVSLSILNVGATGSMSGPTSFCPGTTQNFSIPAVTNATSYIWSYSGTGASFTASTASPTNSIIFSSSATNGTLSVTPANACGNGASATVSITLTVITPATISYPSSAYCSNASGTVTVTRTGPSGGSYSTNPATGLSINTSNGTITPGTSTAGVYTVIYTYSSGSCAGQTATTIVTINPLPVVTANALPSSICMGENVQLSASASAAANYTLSSIPHASLLPSGSPTVLWSSYNDDVISTAISMPFTFNYYGASITQFYVSSNGHIQLQTSSGSSNAEQLVPNATTPNNVIALAWDDLVIDPVTNTGSAVRYFVNGVTPNRVMAIDYINLRFLGGTGAQNVTGQIRLYESDSHIEVAATSVNDNSASRTKTMGIENSTGTIGLSPSGRNLAVWNVTNEAWAFYPPVATFTYAWSPATFLSSTTIANPVATAVSATTTYTVTATNTSTGCAASANTTITATAPLNGTYTVGTAGNFATLTAAINAYNTQCISGPVVFSLISATYSATETYPIVVKKNAYASAVNTLTIRPAAGNTASISGSVSNNCLIRIVGNYVTIDGSNNGTNSRNLTITNSSTTGPRVVHVASNGTVPVVNNTIKNCNLVNGTNTSGSLASTLLVCDSSSMTSPGYFNNITLQNNNIQKGEFGIDVLAVKQTGNGSGLSITQNLVNSTGSNAVSETGIYVEGVDGGVISFNDVGNLSASTAEIDNGLWVALGCRNIDINNNVIHDIRYTGTSGYAGQGIVVSTGEVNASIMIRNNMLYGFSGDGDSYVTYGAGYTPSAIYLYGSSPASQTGISIYHNSIFMNGSTINRTNALSAGIAIDDNNTATVVNNLINNRLGRSATTGIGTVAIALENSSVQLVSSNYNNYHCNATGSGVNVVGRIGATNHTTLANWQTATGQEANSRNILPVFVSGTDLHLVPASNISLSDAGTPVASVTSDYDAQSRNGLTPDIGCDEWLEPNKGSWIGLVSTDWLNPLNWEANYVPDGTTDVYITGGYTFMPTIATTQAVRDLNLSAPGSPSNIPILTINNGILQINRSITRTGGSIIGTNGTVEMNGTAAQSIPASLFQNNRLQNLVIGNSHAASGVTLNGALDIYGSLTFSASGLRLATNNNLTFKSTLAGTAWLGNVTGKTIVGNATVERYIPAGVNHGKSWQLLAVPLSGTQTINQAWQDTATSGNQNRYSGYGTQLVTNISPLPSLFDAVGAAPSVKTYDPAGNAWNGVLNTTSTPIANKKGYLVFVRGDRTVTTLTGAAVPTVLRAKGKLYTTGADLPPATTVGANQFESIGNPYASAIDFLNITKPGPSQVDNAFYVWDPLRYGSWGFGAYQTISSVNGYKPVPGGTANYDSTVTHTRIESGQAFFVHATGASSGGTVSFTEAAKLSGSDMVFRQPSARLQQRQFLHARLSAGTGSNVYLADANLVAFDEEFSNEYNHDDALKMSNPGENIGTSASGKLLAIEARSPIVLSDTIHYHLTNLRRQAYRFTFVPENFGAMSVAAFLADRYLQQLMPVSLTENTIIAFDVTTDPASALPNRFYLIFKPVQTVPVIFGNISAIRKSESAANIFWSVEQEENISRYELQRSFDGRQFDRIQSIQALNNQGGRVDYQITDDRARASELFYRVKAISLDGQTQFSRVARVGPYLPAASMEVFPNPASRNQISVHFINQTAGEYQINLFNETGQLVESDRMSLQSARQVHHLKPHKPLSAGTYQLTIYREKAIIRVISVSVQ